MGIKTYQEKNTNPMKKTRAQSGLPVKKKIQNTTQKYGLKKSDILGSFFYFSRLEDLSSWIKYITVGPFKFCFQNKQTTSLQVFVHWTRTPGSVVAEGQMIIKARVRRLRTETKYG